MYILVDKTTDKPWINENVSKKAELKALIIKWVDYDFIESTLSISAEQFNKMSLNEMAELINVYIVKE